MDRQQHRRNRSPTPSTPPLEYEEYNQAQIMQLPAEPLDDDFSTIPVERLPPQPQRTKQRAIPIPNPGITPGQNNETIETQQTSRNIQHLPGSETRPRFQNENVNEHLPDETIQIQRD
jgi:hypothetical protein